MVRWFDPTQLAGTALQVVVSGFFGAYADKREMQAALAATAVPDDAGYAEDEDLWIDFVADLGDGFEATYTMAYLLAQPSLTLQAGGQTLETTRGRVLVMGGDQVYPVAKRVEYEDRLIGPYQAALPCTPPGESPHLYAIPGNHDWYDGLTSFIRFFCQQQYIAGWQTRQDRSYFAFRLPHGWWLWGLDIQFDAYIDEPQLHYFAKARQLLKPGDRILLVTGKPSWTKGAGNPSYENLRFFEKKMVTGSGASIAVWLSGDLHHYCRYEDAAGRQRITSGGGGAYLFPTHHMEDTLELDEVAGTTPYELRAVFPSKACSKALRWRAPVMLPIRNWRFLRVLAAAYFIPALMLQIPVRTAIDDRVVQFGDVPDLWWHAISSRWMIYASLLMFLVTFAFAAPKNFLWRTLLGIVHAAPHVALFSFLVALSAWALPNDWSRNWGIAVAAGASIVGAPLGMVVFGLYLALGDQLLGEKFERFANESFSCQSIRDYKHFLRLHLGRDGSLTIYPIGVDRVFRRRHLRLDPGGAADAPWFVPEAGHELEPKLLEAEPLVIPPLDAAAAPVVASP